jgi:hypothetical protein
VCDLQASKKEQNHGRSLLLIRELLAEYSRKRSEHNDSVEEHMQRSDDYARFLTLQFTFARWMAHVDPANKRPDIPDPNQAHGNIAPASSEGSSLVQPNIKFDEGELNSCDGCCPADIKCELHLICPLASHRKWSKYLPHVPEANTSAHCQNLLSGRSLSRRWSSLRRKGTLEYTPT